MRASATSLIEDTVEKAGQTLSPRFLSDVNSSESSGRRESLPKCRQNQRNPAMSPAASVAVSGPAIDTSTTKKVDQILRSGDTKMLLKLLSDGELGHGVNVNVFDREGFTPLHKSVLDGNLELVKLLVKVGADPRLASRDGWSALHIASFAGHFAIVSYLLACS